MKNLSGKELARVLERHGWRLLRTHGSHHIYGKDGSIVKSGLLNYILKMAGLDENDL
jgi:predicted RNA binding protein YcfA (HicA-like mRNA interferase family)